MTDPTLKPDFPPTASTAIIVPKPAAPKHLSTQTTYPWRAALRAASASFLSAIVFAIAAASTIADTVNKLLPGTAYGADVLAAAAALGIVAGALNRISNLPQFAAFLTAIHLGPVPKS